MQYNTCDTLELTYAKLSSGIIHEYDDHINLYLNNYRSDTTTARIDKVIVTGVTAEPSFKLTKRALAGSATCNGSYDAEAGTYTFAVGNSSRDIALTAPLKLAEYTEATTNVLKPNTQLNLLHQ